MTKTLLAVGIASDLGLLFAFKYADFFLGSLNQALLVLRARHLLHLPHLALPLGISFFTFHKISYKIDVARGTAEVRRQPLDLLLYILLFPQLIAGPIVRYHDISGELVRRHVTLSDFSEGIRRFILGMGKKMLIANTVALAADRIFSLPSHQLSAPLAWLGAVCYTLQIYFDFSGYSDMALGLARMFGFHFPENFNYPYVSQTITEFWRRWHISLSRWFRDYLYIPLGGNRGSPLRTYFNLAVVFFLCGLWHGANWTFVIWGAFHGALLVIERAGLLGKLERLPPALRHAYTMLLVLFGWVVFRADTWTHARGFLAIMLGMGPRAFAAPALSTVLTPAVQLALVAGLIGSTPWLSAWMKWINSPSRAAGWMVGAAGNFALACVLLLSLMQVAAGTYNPFIYFRF